MHTGSPPILSMDEATPPTILIVDDTPQNLVVLGELLKPHYRIRAATSGELALRAAATRPLPDLILLDVMMPDMDGHRVLRELHNNQETRHVPVIFITALTAMEDEALGLELGAVDYITKPFNPSIVLARVRTHLELKRIRDSLAQQNDWLEREVARRMRENLLIQDMSLKALAHLAEMRDYETGRHITRTQIYVELLARHLAGHPRFSAALTEPALSMIVKATPLHDVGKVGIPDAILLKPGRLDADEFAIMKTHAAIGAESITKAMQEAISAVEGDVADLKGALNFMQVAHEIALTHHEKWDGSGYPAGLSGDNIPVSGRLMALADVFDALSCRRVYKPPMPFETVCQIITEGRGTHFDPDVVDAYLMLRPEFEAIALRYSDEEQHQTT